MDPIELLESRKDGKSLRKLAGEIGISATYLHEILKGQKPVGPKVLAWLGLERMPVSYRKMPARRGK
jgi:transcriptional regulator with XRE-family HTH domain